MKSAPENRAVTEMLDAQQCRATGRNNGTYSDTCYLNMRPLTHVAPQEAHVARPAPCLPSVHQKEAAETDLGEARRLYPENLYHGQVTPHSFQEAVCINQSLKQPRVGLGLSPSNTLQPCGLSKSFGLWKLQLQNGA